MLSCEHPTSLGVGGLDLLVSPDYVSGRSSAFRWMADIQMCEHYRCKRDESHSPNGSPLNPLAGGQNSCGGYCSCAGSNKPILMPFSADGGNGGVFIGVFAVDSADLDGLSSPRELYTKYKNTNTVVVVPT